MRAPIPQTTNWCENFVSGDSADDPALDPSRSSDVVAWLQSAESSWLTGQILRVKGHTLSRIEGFNEATARYHAKDGASLQFSEIGQALSWLYGTSPWGLAGPLPTASPLNFCRVCGLVCNTPSVAY